MDNIRQYEHIESSSPELTRVNAIISSLLFYSLMFNAGNISSRVMAKTRVPISFTYFRNKKYMLVTKKGVIALSRRQIECLQCLVDGLTNTETAKLLFLSARTVETYLGIMRRKFGCKKSIQMVRVLFEIV